MHVPHLRYPFLICCLTFHFILEYACVHAQLLSCPTLCDPMDCSPPGSSVHGLSRARILEWVAISFSLGPSRLRDGTQVSYFGRPIPYLCVTWEATLEYSQLQFSVQFSSVGQLCMTLCNPMDSITPGLPDHHQLPEIAQTQVH